MPAEDRRELYDLEADPAERHDLVRDAPQTAASLHERLRAWREGAPEGAPAALPAAERARLEALGYVE